MPPPAENFERIIVTCGGKPNCGIGLKVNHLQIDDAFCLELYKTLEQETKPLGNHVGYLLAHYSLFIN